MHIHLILQSVSLTTLNPLIRNSIHGALQDFQLFLNASADQPEPEGGTNQEQLLWVHCVKQAQAQSKEKFLLAERTAAVHPVFFSHQAVSWVAHTNISTNTLVIYCMWWQCILVYCVDFSSGVTSQIRHNHVVNSVDKDNIYRKCIIYKTMRLCLLISDRS